MMPTIRQVSGLGLLVVLLLVVFVVEDSVSDNSADRVTFESLPRLKQDVGIDLHPVQAIQPTRTSQQNKPKSQTPGWHINEVELRDVELFGRKVYYRFAASPEENHRPKLVLLHGSRYNSETWEKLRVVKSFLTAGYDVYMIDLPGGKGGSPHLSKAGGVAARNGEYLIDLLKALNIEKPVLVSPSASGRFAIPLLLNIKSYDLSGFVPIAPTTVKASHAVHLMNVQVPTLIMYGEKDNHGAMTSVHLSNLPQSSIEMFSGAGHACYIEQPKHFRDLLLDFMSKLPDV